MACRPACLSYYGVLSLLVALEDEATGRHNGCVTTNLKHIRPGCHRHMLKEISPSEQLLNIVGGGSI